MAMSSHRVLLVLLTAVGIGYGLIPRMPGGRSLRIERRGVPNEEIDEMINEFVKTPAFDLPNKITSERVMRTVGRPQFFLRIAELCDQAETSERREALAALADNLSATLSALAQRTQSRMEDASERLAHIIEAAAEDGSGEFLVPLSKEKLQALREAVEEALANNALDESVLSTVHACTKKAQDDGLDGLVAILRKLLQLYAASTLSFNPNNSNQTLHPDYQAAVDCYTELMATDADKHWDSILKTNLLGDTPLTGKSQLLAVVQAQIEQTVLLQENGSFAQRVQAEFLREIVARIEAILPTSLDDLTQEDSDDLLTAFLTGDQNEQTEEEEQKKNAPAPTAQDTNQDERRKSPEDSST